MDIANLCLRMIDKKGAVYAPYVFDGEFTEQEKSVIKSAIDKHVPEKVDAMFNNWIFTKSAIDFGMYRSTWESGVRAQTAEELARAIENYYTRMVQS